MAIGRPLPSPPRSGPLETGDRGFLTGKFFLKSRWPKVRYCAYLSVNGDISGHFWRQKVFKMGLFCDGHFVESTAVTLRVIT